MTKLILSIAAAAGLLAAQVAHDYGGRLVENGINNLGAIAGTNTYTVSPTPAVVALTQNVSYCGYFTNANTGAATLNISSLGATSLVKLASTALASGDIAATSSHCFVYNGTNLVIDHIDNAAGGSGTVTSITASSPLTGGTITGSGSVGLDTTKVPQKFFGTTAPGSVSGNLPGDQYTDTTNHHQYVCNAPSGTAAPACTSVAAAGWLQVDSTGAAPLSTVGAGYDSPFGLCDYCQAGSAIVAHDVWAFQGVPRVGITVSTIMFPNGANATGTYGAVCIYADSAGSPGALLGQTTPASVAVATSTAVFMSMASPVTLSAGTPYWFGITSDGAGLAWMGPGTGMAYSWNQTGHPRIVRAQSGSGNQSTGTTTGLTCPSTLGAATASASQQPAPIRLLP